MKNKNSASKKHRNILQPTETGLVEWFDYKNATLNKLPDNIDRYFTKTKDAIKIPVSKLETPRAREKGVKNANKFMRLAYDGEMPKRKPISVNKVGNKYIVLDGNSTVANAKYSGWNYIYAQEVDAEEVLAKGGYTSTWGGASGGLNIPQLSFDKTDYNVNVQKTTKGYEVDVNIEERDSVDYDALNDAEAEWSQFSWGYMVYPKSVEQLYKVLKALRCRVSKDRLNEWASSGKYEKGGQTKDTWNTQELQEDFKVLGFGYGYIAVERRSDGIKGSLNFKGSPRRYFDFVEHK